MDFYSENKEFNRDKTNAVIGSASNPKNKLPTSATLKDEDVGSDIKKITKKLNKYPKKILSIIV